MYIWTTFCKDTSWDCSTSRCQQEQRKAWWSSGRCQLSHLCVKRHPAQRRGWRRNPSRRLPKQTWFISISAFWPSGCRAGGRHPWHTAALCTAMQNGFIQTCSSGCISKHKLTKEERREIPNLGVSKSLSPASFGRSDYSNRLSQPFLWIKKR